MKKILLILLFFSSMSYTSDRTVVDIINEFELNHESNRKEAIQRFIEIIQDYQSKTNAGLPKAVTKFLPVCCRTKGAINMAKFTNKGLAKAGDRVLSGSWSVRTMIKSSSKKQSKTVQTEKPDIKKG